ncbi:hypothetical protein AUJ14_02650 [Candidatus Micrarchaeota archaeon CG1_02_55_22]|nr:MAG: hypothetical protein AUJ14_02650 [Candidatus Micrarchaeota archaeon CG1_02_55_22]
MSKGKRLTDEERHKGVELFLDGLPDEELAYTRWNQDHTVHPQIGISRKVAVQRVRESYADGKAYAGHGTWEAYLEEVHKRMIPVKAEYADFTPVKLARALTALRGNNYRTRGLTYPA